MLLAQASDLSPPWLVHPNPQVTCKFAFHFEPSRHTAMRLQDLSK